MYTINQNTRQIYNAKWIKDQVCTITYNPSKTDIIQALETMSQIELHHAKQTEYKFIAWDICRSEWQKDYESGKIGSYAWDIACIINHMNDARLSEVFLENYLRHGGTKPTLVALYANLYYISVFESIKSNDFEKIIKTTKEIVEETIYKTDIISYETLIKLNINGY